MNVLTPAFIRRIVQYNMFFVQYNFSHDQEECFICGIFLHSPTAENFLHAAEQRAKQVHFSGLHALSTFRIHEEQNA